MHVCNGLTGMPAAAVAAHWHIGSGEAHLVQRHPDRRVAPYGRDLRRRRRVQHPHGLEPRRAARRAQVHLRGTRGGLPLGLGWVGQGADGRPRATQLFENQSVVEYWENFANHAFENTTQSVYSHCVLLKPNGAPVPCTFCFSIRRDIMDLPSLVIGASFVFYRAHSASDCVWTPPIGQWLPLL